MALLEHKKNTARIESNDATLYLLDEPDTHLHVKAQLDLLDTLMRFSEQGHQVIVSTHSPFLINAVRPHNILMLCPTPENCTEVKALRPAIDGTDEALRAMGIENVYLFFARDMILVEGETERHFLNAHWIREVGKEPSASLIKIVNVDGIGNVYGFSRAVSEIHNPERIRVMHDNEMSEDISQLISELSIPEKNRYIIGKKEFEDAFAPEALFKAWEDYLYQYNRKSPEGWSIESIADCKQRCFDNDALKFSRELRKLFAGSGKKMTKPVYGAALGRYLDKSLIPESIAELVDNLYV